MVLASGMARVRAWACASLLIVLAALPWTAALADGLSPALQKGVAWLGAQVQSDGSLAGESASIALPLQAREETFVTLGQLATAPSALSAAIAANTDSNVAYRTRRMLAAGANGETAPADVAALLAQQNTDGGWGFAPGYASTALDTAFALQALAAVHATAPAAVGNALAYLAQARLADNGYGMEVQSSVFISANVLLGAAAWSNPFPSGSTVAGYARDWLLAQRTAAQDFGSVLGNAVALRALATQTTQAAILQPVTTALAAAQRSDGSWAGDPYQTALALNALWFASQPGTAPTTGGVQGSVVDATGTAISAATLQLVGTGATTSSAADGAFTLSGIAPGGYGLRVSSAGYQERTLSVQILAGQIANLGAIALQPLALTASVGGVVKDNAGKPLPGAFVAIGTASATTDANGAYQIAGLSPGTVSVSVTLANYQTATASFSVVAGTRYVFSPTLYPNSTPPPGTSLQGVVVDGATQNPIVGASVLFNGTTQATDANGRFAFGNLPVGPFALAINASGYQSAGVGGALGAGVNDIGTIALSAVPKTSRLSGHVTDADTHAPIAGASLTVQGEGLGATSDATGAYRIDGVVGTTLTLDVGVAGYAAQVLTVNLPQIGDSTLDVVLAKPAASGIRFSELQPDHPSIGPHDDVELDAQLANSNANSVALLVQAVVKDATGNIVFVIQANPGFGVPPPNQPVIVPAHGTLDVPMKRALLRQAAGTYQVHAQAIDGSGVVLAEADTQFTVLGDAILAGGLTPNPPLAQIGSQQPIALSADLTNVGNQDIPAGNLDLRITLTQPDDQSLTAPVTLVKGLADGTPYNTSRGLVADSSGNVYTANYVDSKILKLDSSGVTSVAFQFPQNIYPIGLSLDAQGTFWLPTRGGGIYAVSPQGTTRTVAIPSLQAVNGLDLAANGDLLLTGAYAGEQRLVRHTTQGVDTVLWRNGLNQPNSAVTDGSGGTMVTNYGDGTLSRVSSSGTLTLFATGLNHPTGIERDAQGNYYVATLGDNTIVKVSPSGQLSTFASGLNLPFDVRFDAGGNLFVANQGDNSIVEIAPAGAKSVFARGLAYRPAGMKYDAAGNLWIANSDGTVRKQDTAGNVTIVASGLSQPSGLAIDAGGNALVADNSSGVIKKIGAAGTSTFAAGLSSPWGVAADAGGNVYVTEHGANRISVFNGPGAKTGQVDSAIYLPDQVRVGSNGEIYVRNSGSITVIQNGVPRKLVDAISSSSISPDPVHGGLVASTGYDVYRIALDGSTLRLNATSLPFYSSGIGVDAAGNVLLLDFYNNRIQKLDASGNATVLATLPAAGAMLATDLSGRASVLMSDSVTLYAVDGAGALTKIAAPANELAKGLSTAANGNLLLTTASNRVYAIDPSTAAATRLLNNSKPLTGAAQDASGTLYVTDYADDELRTYDASGNAVAVLDGFYQPWDIVWTGTDLKFVDSSGSLYSLVPGGYPVKLGAFAPHYLAAVGGEIYGPLNGSGIVHWNGSGAETWTSLAGFSFDGGIAARSDGALTASEDGSSRVITFDASKNVLSVYAGLVQPTGLAFDSSGRLYVSNYGSGTIARFDAGSAAPKVFASDTHAAFIAFDGSGNLWVTRQNGVDRIDASGVVTLVTQNVAFNGLLIDGARIFAVDSGNALLRSWNGSDWVSFAAGLSAPQGVYAAPNGDIYVANSGNGTVTRLSGNTLSVVAGELPGASVVRAMSDGTLYAGGTSGALYAIAPDGTRSDPRVAGSVDYLTWYGLAPGATPDTFYGLVSGYNSGAARYDDQIVRVTRTQAPTPPAPGTVVYQASFAQSDIPAVDGYTHFDFGTWLPPYGGDFRIDVTRAGVDGSATNFVHVGPSAYGALTALEPELPPGDQTETLCLSLTGADFTSLSRVEASQVRVISHSGEPSGLATDKAGNLYFTSNGGLYKTDTSGRIAQLAGGLRLANGLAADSNENLYVPAYDTTTGYYDLLKFDRNGVQSKVADLGVRAANGVAVDSHDNVLVGSPGVLLKVDAQGNVGVLSRAGLPNPLGLAIDGKDNVYIENNAGYVSRVRPDGSSSDLFSADDGVVDPAFEGDGHPTIAADCSDNFYLATQYWTKAGITGQTDPEEHTLTQVIPRTGQVSMLFDTLAINPVLSDIDYLAFDRFGNRILMWNHMDGSVWQVPVTCGAIGVNAHVVTRPGQTITGATVPTSSVIARADGSKEYVWSLKDVTASGQQVCFDTQLKALTLGETRPTLASSFITFQNSFAANDIQQALDVPAVHVADWVNVSVSTDQAEYPAQATAQITTTLTNANPTIAQGTLVVNVYDASGAFVGGVTRQDVSVPALGSLPVTAPFAIGAILPAQYTITAVLSFNGTTLAHGQAAFDVLPNNAASSATSFVHTDKQSYNPNDTVVIGSRAQSLSSNVVLGNLTLMLTVRDASGTVQFTHGFPIAQLLPGATLDFSVPQTLSNAAPGIYTVKQDLLDDANHLLSHVEAAYNVASTSDTGFGLSGAIAASPKSLPLGGTLTLTANATNQGNSALSNVPLRIALVDPATGAVLQSFTQNANLAVGASVPFTATWAVTGTPGATYFAVLSASVGTGSGTKNLTLAVDTYALTKPAFHLDATVSLSATPPPLAALVLVDSTAASAANTRVAQALNAVGYVGTFVATQADFANAMQSGAYSAYLLLATGAMPDATTQRLLREGVHRGEGLIVANGAAPLPDALAQVAGLVPSSGLTAVNAQSLDTLPSAPGGAAHEAFNPTLASRFVVANGAQTLATQATRLAATPDSGTLSSELALRGRVDVGYFGNDAGSGNTQLALTSLGRLQNAGGSAIATVWRIRNSGTTARSVTLASSDLTYALPLTVAAQTDTFIASPDIAGSATHTLSAAGRLIDTQAAIASVFSDARLVDVGDNPGAIALWANAIGVGDTLDWSGAQHTLHGAVHSNGDIVLSGAQNLVDGPLHYVTRFANSGSQNTFTYLPRQVAPQPMPTPLNLDDFKPGGAVAKAVGAQYFDQTAECASKHTWQRSGNKVSLAAGVYWIPCDVHIAGNGPNGTVSLVSTGAIQIDGASPNFKPFYQGVQFATSLAGAGAIKLTGSSMQVGGLVFAPRGTVEASGSAMNFQCSIIADQIRLAGAKTTIDVRQCAYATEQRQLPALLWNAFGTGTAAYAAFDWQGAIGTYEAAAPGVLARLFGGVLARVAPGSAALRAGTIVPLKLSVQSTADPFTGALTLAANDDSTFVPAAAPWALDFTHTPSFQAQSNVRLGSGATTGLTATVSAATPSVVNPLKQGTLSLAHLPGESIANLVTAAAAIASPDAALTAAATALQAAQTALAAGDRSGAVGHLLDAAEDCGNSSNAQADALRTRIDWVIWATTH